MTLSLPELRARIAAARAMDAPVLLLPDEAEALVERVGSAERCACAGTLLPIAWFTPYDQEEKA